MKMKKCNLRKIKLNLTKQQKKSKIKKKKTRDAAYVQTISN